MRKGFTLIELLVVIAIIGILSAIILASLNRARMSAKDARIASDLVQLRNALELTRNNIGVYDGLMVTGYDSRFSLKTNDSSFASVKIREIIRDIGLQSSGYGQVFYYEGGSTESSLYISADGLTSCLFSCSGSFPTHVIIFGSQGQNSSYAIYARTSTSYVCIDSKGNAVKSGDGSLTVPLTHNDPKGPPQPPFRYPYTDDWTQNGNAVCR